MCKKQDSKRKRGATKNARVIHPKFPVDQLVQDTYGGIARLDTKKMKTTTKSMELTSAAVKLVASIKQVDENGSTDEFEKADQP